MLVIVEHGLELLLCKSVHVAFQTAHCLEFRWEQLTAYALTPYSDDTLDTLVELGRLDAAAWADAYQG